MKTEKLEMIKVFAKENKLGAKKLQAFIADLESQTPMGRKAKDDTKIIREHLVQMAKQKELTGRVTSKDVMAALNNKMKNSDLEVTPVDVNNALRWVSTRHGLCSPTGDTMKVPKGRPMCVWQF